MYFPYLRGRQFELIAIRELVEQGLIGNKIIPIIEPIKPSSTLCTTLQAFSEKNRAVALVINPGVGNFISEINKMKKEEPEMYTNIMSELGKSTLIRSYLIKENAQKLIARQEKDSLRELLIINTNRDCMDDYFDIFTSIHPKYSLIPDDRTFSRKVKGSKVLFEDKFIKLARNVDYTETEDEFFSEDHLFFSEEGFSGFSDYSVIGSEFSDSGFAPRAVAIHLTYFTSEKILRVRHFVSDSNNDFKDPANKFGEALEKLIKWCNEKDIYKTAGLLGFYECHKLGRYPGLGTAKKLSIMHHLELMNGFLEEKKV